MKQVTIYTDGACSGNPGPGGWAAVLQYRDNQMELSGYEAETTNNRMELTAPIEALERLKEPCEVKVYSDSSYLINAFNRNWLASWQKRNWVRSNGDPVLNADLWEKLLALSARHRITWVKVKGHASDELNNRCDRLAVAQIKAHRRD